MSFTMFNHRAVYLWVYQSLHAFLVSRSCIFIACLYYPTAASASPDSYAPTGAILFAREEYQYSHYPLFVSRISACIPVVSSYSTRPPFLDCKHIHHRPHPTPKVNFKGTIARALPSKGERTRGLLSISKPSLIRKPGGASSTGQAKAASDSEIS